MDDGAGEERGERRALQKWLQDRGFGSRREVQELIASGRVTLGGALVTRFAEAVGEGVQVCVDGRSVEDRPAPVVLLMHKPRGHVTKLVDPEGLPALGQYLPPELPFVFPVGRLDVTSEGALLLTNDGQLAHRVLHPDWELPKWYGVKLRGHLDAGDFGFKRMRRGITTGGDTFKPALVEVGELRTRATWVHITITEGRHRQVRRMCGACGFQIIKLRRLGIGPIQLGALNPRCVRALEDAERDALYRAVGLEPPLGGVTPAWPEEP